MSTQRCPSYNSEESRSGRVLRFCTSALSLTMGWASWIADAGSCDKPLVTSWFPVLYAWYAPMSSGAAGSMNDAARFVRTLSQHAVQPTPGAEGLARYACTRAASARLTLRNVAGVLKPTKPGPGSKENAVAAWSSVLAESSSERTYL